MLFAASAVRNISSLPTKPTAGGTPATLNAPTAKAVATSLPRWPALMNSRVLFKPLITL